MTRDRRCPYETMLLGKIICSYTRTCGRFTNNVVMLSEAKHLCLSPSGNRMNDQRFFASLRMTLMKWLVEIAACHCL